MSDFYKHVDAICCVLASQRSRETIDKVLRTFVPECESLSNDYACPPDDPSSTFSSSDEMIDHFVFNTNYAQTFFWNQHKDSSERIMVGAFFTEDGYLIMSLTVPADGEIEKQYFARLKTTLQTDVGTIAYTNPPPFENGADFIDRYGN